MHNTGELRYLKFQGNGENTSSFPKFEIANYDVTRTKMCSLPSRTFVKSALLQNVCTLVIRCVPPTLFTHKYRGQIMGAISTTDKTFGPFSEWDFSPKKTFSRRVFSSQNVNKENSSGNFTCLRYRAFTYSPLYLTHKLTLVLL